MDPQFSYTVLLDPVDPQYSSFMYEMIREAFNKKNHFLIDIRQ